MKRGIALFLTVILLFTLLPGRVSASGDLRHQVYGDVSELEIDEEAGLSQSDANGAQAQIGTDIYLFVDPDTASYVTFYVTDEQGNPLKNAQIYLTYQGITEFFGTTGSNGKFESYLFRNVDYGFTIKLSGYETAVGSFTATEELSFIHVVLRKYHGVDIYVVNNGVPVPNTDVVIDGVTYTTDENGKITIYKTDGVYTGTLTTEDGREILFQFTVSGSDITKVIDIGTDETLVKDGIRQDSFLVYDRDYDPEDYVLTYYRFTEEDLTQGSKETDEEFEARTQRYLQQNPSAVLVEAQPDRKQNTTGKDTDLLNDKKQPLYTQRSMMPSGYLLKAWEEEEYTQLIFTNEEMGLRMELEDLHNPQMTKVFALAWYLTDEDVCISDICKEEIEKEDYDKTGIPDAEKNVLDLDEIDMTALKDFEFEFVHEWLEHPELKKKEKHDLLADSLYTSTVFEFRLTPITHDALREMICDGLEDKEALERDSIMVANYSYFLEVLRRWRAEGNLDDNEAEELYQFVIDGKLTAEEIEQLKKDYEEGKLSNAAIDALLEAAMEEKLYRISCWVRYQDVVVNVTELLDSLELIRNADAQYEAYYQQLVEENEQLKEEDRLDEKELQAEAEKLLEKGKFLIVDNDEELYDAEDYVVGDAAEQRSAKLICSMPEEENEFYDLVSALPFRSLIVDVRLEELKIEDSKLLRHVAKYQEDTVYLELHRALTCKSSKNALTGLVYPNDESK